MVICESNEKTDPTVAKNSDFYKLRRKIIEDTAYTGLEIMSTNIFRPSDSSYNLSLLNDEVARPEVFDNLTNQVALSKRQSVRLPYSQQPLNVLEEEKKQ